MFLPRVSAGPSTVTWTMPPDDLAILSSTSFETDFLKLDPYEKASTCAGNRGDPFFAQPWHRSVAVTMLMQIAALPSAAIWSKTQP